MDFKKARGLSKLISFIFTANNPEATQGTLKVGGNNVELHINGGFRRLSISFNGSIYIYNNLIIQNGMTYQVDPDIAFINYCKDNNIIKEGEA